jgi:hypothetical protein
MNYRMMASWAAVVLGVLMIVGGATTWFIVGNTLGDQMITTSDDACLAGQAVDGPFTAYCQAEVINEHTMESTGGLTYAQLDRDDPLRATAMNSAFLQASLFTSVVAFGVAAMAVGMGVVFVLIGLGMRDVAEVVAQQPVRAG